MHKNLALADKENSYPNQLSRGEQQRVAIARALVVEPKIIFADEPTDNLDSKTSKQIMELFKNINKLKNITILQVTHSQEIAEYCDRIIRMSEYLQLSGNKENSYLSYIIFKNIK